MLINTDREREAKVSVQVSGFAPAAVGELATVGSREYCLNNATHRLLWSTGPRIEKIKTGSAFGVTLAPFSMTFVRVPDRAKPGLSRIARKALSARPHAPGKPELRFVLPTEVYAGDRIPGELIALSAGSQLPYGGTLAPAALAAVNGVAFDRSTVRLAGSVGNFIMKPSTPGDLTLTARSGDVEATHRLTVKPSVPRPVIFWDFSNPSVNDRTAFSSDFHLVEDTTERANRAVARVDFPADGAKGKEALKVLSLPEGDRLKKENVRGVVFDMKTSADFSSEDPDAGITVVMQSPANWWMNLGSIALKDAKQWKTHRLDVTNQDYITAMRSAMNIIFILQADRPVKGSICFDCIGFMVR